VPALLGDWKKSVLEAASQDDARQELWPELEKQLAAAQQKKGALLEDDEAETIADAFYEKHEPRLEKLARKHLESYGKTATQKDATITKVVDGARPRIATRRDPFTPVAQKDPQARAREVVLWENADAMVLIDLFVGRPKALVVPKATVSFPGDAPAGMLDELARIAAHVSDAFMGELPPKTGAAKPAGIWVNPPQHLTVKQLHVHVAPQAAAWTELLGLTGLGRARAGELARDPQARPAMMALFKKLTVALEASLGPST
jgi:diadenosine tetraphosphate (Ap4A) HIT family hydrolase